MRVGVLAIQGSVVEHMKVLQQLNTDPALVRDRTSLAEVSHLVIPGGESTTLQLLLEKYGLWSLLRRRIQSGDLKLFGTCAGAILCSRLGAGWEVDRNGFGAQQQSFSAVLDSDTFSNLRGVFIRAPQFKNIHSRCDVLATFENEPVLLHDGPFLAASFHSELSGDVRLHEFFLNT